jgi:hypothetical protein
VAGTNGLGGGGGGGGTPPGPRAAVGGSGIIIIAYADTERDLSSVGAGLTVNGSAGNTSPVTSRSGYKLYSFTAGTGDIKF